MYIYIHNTCIYIHICAYMCIFLCVLITIIDINMSENPNPEFVLSFGDKTCSLLGGNCRILSTPACKTY